MTIAGRSLGALALTVLMALLGLASLFVALQFLGVVDWERDALDFWGGKWAGVFLFGLLAGVSLVTAWGWLTGGAWARPITLLLGLLAVSNGVMAILAGTETLSTVLAPVALGIVAVVLAFITPVTGNAPKNKKSKPSVTKRPPAMTSDEV